MVFILRLRCIDAGMVVVRFFGDLVTAVMQKRANERRFSEGWLYLKHRAHAVALSTGVSQ